MVLHNGSYILDCSRVEIGLIGRDNISYIINHRDRNSLGNVCHTRFTLNARDCRVNGGSNRGGFCLNDHMTEGAYAVSVARTVTVVVVGGM